MRFLTLLLLALAGVLGLSAPNAGPAYAGKKNDTLVWATDRELAIIDPFYFNARENIIIGHMVMDTLIFADPKNGEIKPLLATAWRWIDPTTIEFDIRDGVKFHSGKVLDADDVAYSLTFVSRKEHGVRNYTLLSWIKSAEKVGPLKVRVYLEQPFQPALAYLASLGFIVEKGHYDNAPVGGDGKQDYGAVPMGGTGPYKLAELKPGEYVQLVRNPDYFGTGYKPKAAIGALRFRTIRDPNTRLAELMTGGVDWIWDVPKHQADRIMTSPTLEVVNAKTYRIGFISFDVLGRSDSKLFMDKRVRQAVAHAINRDAIAKNLVGPVAVGIQSACHPDQYACATDVPPYEYNPAKARELLAAAGHPNGFEVDLYAYREREFTEAVIGDLAKVGIRAKLNFLQLASLLSLVHKGRVTFHHSTWGSNSIADASAVASQYLLGGVDDLTRDPALIAMIHAADAVTDPGQRKAAWRAVLLKIQEEAYWLPLYTYAKYYAYTKDLIFEPTADELPPFWSARWR